MEEVHVFSTQSAAVHGSIANRWKARNNSMLDHHNHHQQECVGVSHLMDGKCTKSGNSHPLCSLFQVVLWEKSERRATDRFGNHSGTVGCGHAFIPAFGPAVIII